MDHGMLHHPAAAEAGSAGRRVHSRVSRRVARRGHGPRAHGWLVAWPPRP